MNSGLRCKWLWAVIAAAACVQLTQPSIALGDEENELLGLKWDCVVNKTGMTVKAYVISQHGTVSKALAPDGKLEFIVPSDVKRVVLVAFQYNTNKLVTMKQFQTLPQNYPPSNCYPIKKNMTAQILADEEADDRVQAEADEGMGGQEL